MNRALFSVVIVLSISFAKSAKVQNFVLNEPKQDFGFEQICENDLFKWGTPAYRNKLVNNVFWFDLKTFGVFNEFDDTVVDEFIESKKRLSNEYPSKHYLDSIMSYMKDYEKYKENEDKQLVFNRTSEEHHYNNQILKLGKFAINGQEDFDKDTFKGLKSFFFEVEARVFIPIHSIYYPTPRNDCKKATDLPAFFSKKGQKSDD